MIWKRILPRSGGSLRRLIRIRKEMFELSLEKRQSNSFDKPQLPMRPLTIIDFKRHDDAADARAVSIGSKKQGWRISDDEVIGGYSRGTFTLMNDFQNTDVTNQDDSEDKRERDNEMDMEKSDIQPFVRWQGNIDTRVGPKSRAKRSGFCAIRCPEFPGSIPVGAKYNALEIQCRPDGRTYTFNLKVQTYFPDDLYQSLITVQPEDIEEHKRDGFVSVVLPFRDFLLTSHGTVKSHQRSLDGGIELQHFGLTLMDGKDGPFCFDISKIRLVNYDSVEEKIIS